MSNYDEARQPSGDGEIFRELMGGNESFDAAIIAFEDLTQSRRERLTEEYVGKDPRSYSLMETIGDELVDEWGFYLDVATVTGRLYLTDEAPGDIEGLVPEEWGHPLSDENRDDDDFYFVENVRLRSHGITIVQRRDDDTGLITSVDIVYLFSLESDQEKQAIFEAYMGELSTHAYDIPSAEEARERLARQWPKMLKSIDQVVRPDLNAALPQRLGFLIHRLQSELQNSDQFAELVYLYVNERLHLDGQLPYIVTAKHYIRSYDGHDPHDDDSEGSWLDIKIPESLTFLAFEPCIHIFTSLDGQKSAHIMASVYSEEDGDEPEFVAVDVKNIHTFRSTRVMRSLISRALFNSDDEQFTMPAEDQDIPLDEGTMVVEDSPIVMTGVSDLERSTEPEIIRNMKFLESTFDSLAKYIKTKTSVTYNTYEEAKSVADSLIDDEIYDDLIEAGIKEYKFEVSGRGVMVPQHVDEHINGESTDQVFRLAFDSNEPLIPLAPGDSVFGHFVSLNGLTNVVTDNDGTVIGYRAYPALFIEISHQQHSAVRWDNVSLADIDVQTRAAVGLDGSADIKMTSLEIYRDSQVVYRRMKETYGAKAPIVNTILRLDAAFVSEQATGFINLKRIQRMAQLDEHIKNLVAKGRSPAVALEAIEALFINRAVEVRGEIYKEYGEKIVVDDESSMDEFMLSYVVDVRNDLMNDDVTLVLQVKDEKLRYVPVKSITALRF